MEFNFQSIEKSKFGNTEDRMTPNSIVVGKKSIGISRDIMEGFTETRYTGPNGKHNYVKLVIAYDSSRHAIRLSENQNGFNTRLNNSGKTGSLYLPSSLKNLGVAVGKYILVDGTSNIFQLKV